MNRLSKEYTKLLYMRNDLCLVADDLIRSDTGSEESMKLVIQYIDAAIAAIDRAKLNLHRHIESMKDREPRIAMPKRDDDPTPH